MRKVTRAGVRWPRASAVRFYLFGLGSFAVVEFGFLGVYSTQLRFAFTTRIALLLFAVPALLAWGKPITLARTALTGLPLRLLERILSSRLVSMMGSSIFAPVFAFAAFSVFLTPLAGTLRLSWVSEALITVLVPVVGLIMVLPLTEVVLVRTGLFILVEFLLTFVELIIDAIPGILLRINVIVLDHVSAPVGPLAWFPSPLRDQQLSGDLLWLIAELADIPVLVLLFVRWFKQDRGEAKITDDLSDDELDALTAAHLAQYGPGREH